MIECCFCGKLFKPDNEYLKQWIETGNKFDPTDWVCTDCENFCNGDTGELSPGDAKIHWEQLADDTEFWW